MIDFIFKMNIIVFIDYYSASKGIGYDFVGSFDSCLVDWDFWSP